MSREMEEPEGSPWSEQGWIGEWPTELMVGLSSVEDLTRNAEAWVMHPEFPGWRFLVTFSPAGVPVGFRIEADKGFRMDPWLSGDPAIANAGHSPTAPPITARFLRQLPLGEIQNAARHAVLKSAAADDRAREAPERSVTEHWERTFDETRRPGRRGRDDRFYAELAAAYVDRVQVKKPSARPVEDLANDMGYSPSQIRNLLYVARKRELLTSAPAGRPGGELTAKARHLLEAGEGK